MNPRKLRLIKRILRNAWLLAGVLSLAAAGVVLAASGDLDTSFSGDGKVLHSPVPGGSSQPMDLAIQADGKILAVGDTSSSVANDNIVLFRYTAAGAIDTTFGASGKKVVDLGGHDFGLGIAVSPINGRIVVAGETCDLSGPDCDLALLRLTPNGALDTTFNKTGKRIDDFGGGYNGASPGLVIQADGKIVVGGSMKNASTGTYDFAVYRYTSSGAPDLTFSGDGKQSIAFTAGRDDYLAGVAVMPDGRIVAAGHTCTPTFSSCDIAVARLKSNGGLDGTFHATGKVVTNIAVIDQASGVALQSLGRVVVAGWSNPGGVTQMALVRYTAAGNLDTTFGGTGKVITNFAGGGSSSSARAVVAQSDGRLVVCGQSGYPGNFALARYNSNGSLDSTFSLDGKAVVDFGRDDGCNAIARQANGRYVVAGGRYESDPLSLMKWALARVMP